MPLPSLLAFALVSGLTASLAGRQELRQSPRPIPLTRSFHAFVSFVCLVVVPVSAYFYVFHGDWFLLYAIDVQRIPSAIALIGFGLQAALGIASFLLGASLVRNQREGIVGVLLGVCALGGGLAVFLYTDRLSQVGTHAQFHGQFGLEPYGGGPLVSGGMAMGAIVLVGFAFLLIRLWMSGRAR